MINEITTSVNPEKLDRYYFPINVDQVKDLLGKTLTQLEVMNLRNEKATKDVFRQLIWSWFSNVQDNSVTSYQGCIAPIFDFSERGEIVKDGPQTNRWEPICPNRCGENASCSECPQTVSDQGVIFADEYDDDTGTVIGQKATLESIK